MNADKEKEVLSGQDPAGQQVPDMDPDTSPNGGGDDGPEKITHTVKDLLQEIEQQAELIQAYKKNQAELDPIIQEELKKPEYNGLTFEALFNSRAANLPTFYKLIINALEKAKTGKKDLPVIAGGGVPKNLVIPNNKLMHALGESYLNRETGKYEFLTDVGAVDLPVFGDRSKIKTYVLARFTGPDTGGPPASEFTKAVISAWLTRYLDAKKRGAIPFVTAKMICRTMTHKTDAEDVGPKLVKRVEEEIQRMLNLNTEIDASDEMTQRKATYNGKLVESFKQKSNVFEAIPTEIKSGGETISGYIINESAVLLYIQLTRQLLIVPGEMMDVKRLDKKGHLTPVSITFTEDRISIIHYLARRVEVMRRDEEQAKEAFRKYIRRARKDDTLPAKRLQDFRNPLISRTMLAETIMKESGVPVYKNAKTNNKKFILQVLDYYRAAGFISGYDKRNVGRTYDAVTIKFKDS